MSGDDEEIPEIFAETETVRTGTPPEDAGRRIGPYVVIRELGQGGMGKVYLAARADEQYQKRVAIKVIKGAVATDEVVRHFRRERQILASIDHPNVAKLLDGGATEDGLPYFVMEHVQGQSLLEYCDRRSLDIASRLRLFQGVLAAVQHAHRNLIVHRDIKPGNILVTEDGVPKLLDFGIAKLLNADLTSVDPQTVTARALTPEYASPEQARGEPITTASDVYSLGMVLYELLTGHYTYRLTSRNPLDVLRAVVEQEPERPSTAIDRTERLAAPSSSSTAPPVTAQSVSRTREGTPDRLRRRLRGDLDNITMTALRKEPTRRYASVEALSEDIRRYLEGRPVAARRGGLGYKLGKFVARNRVAAAASLLAFVLLVGATVTTAFQNRRFARERERAERVSAFLVDLFKVSDPDKARGSTITAREVLDQGADRIAQGLDDQPDVRATLLETMGRVYHNLGLLDRASGLLQQAIGLRRQGAGADAKRLVVDLKVLGLIQDDKGDYAGAQASYQEALALGRRVFGEGLDVAQVLNNLGNTSRNMGDYAAAEGFLNQSLALKRRLFGEAHEEVALTLSSLAIVTAVKGDPAAAEPLFRQVVEIDRRALGPDSPRVANDLNNLGAALGDKGDWAGAEAIHREALALRRKLYGTEHPNIAESLNNVGKSLYYLRRYSEAEPLFHDAIAMRKTLLGDDHPLVARSMKNLADVLRERGSSTEAEATYRQALAIQRRRLGEGHPLVAETSANLATVVAARGELHEAEALLRAALAALAKAQGEDSSSSAEVAVELGSVLVRAGRAAEAEPLIRHGLEVLRKDAANRVSVAEAESVLGECLLVEGRREEAEPLLRHGHATVVSERGADSREAKVTAARLGRLGSARTRSRPGGPPASPAAVAPHRS
jgi:serine/threonine-protein kinase